MLVKLYSLRSSFESLSHWIFVYCLFRGRSAAVFERVSTYARVERDILVKNQLVDRL